MEGNILDTSSKSGVYKCTTCETLSVHIVGYLKEPCSECGSNCNWVVKNNAMNTTKNVHKYKYKCR